MQPYSIFIYLSAKESSVKFSVILFLGICFFAKTSAQNAPALSLPSGGSTIAGIIFSSEKGKPLSDALLRIKGSGIKTSTGKRGEFILNLPEAVLAEGAVFEVEVTKSGFEKTSFKVKRENLPVQTTAVLYKIEEFVYPPNRR